MIKFLTLIALLFPLAAIAQDASDNSHRYQPEYCEFGITLPSEPYETRRCNPDKPTECVLQQSFTQVYSLDATVNIRVTCDASTPEQYANYDETTTRALLRALTSRSIVDTFNTTYREDTGGRFKQGGVVGEGQSGNQPNIYLAQFWIGRNSVMTIEAELIGQPHDTADALFRDILQSTGYAPKYWENNAPPENGEDEDQ